MSAPNYEYNPATKTCVVSGANTFPLEILQFTDMAVLQMQDGTLTDIPESIKMLPRLRVAFFRDHQFTRLPESLAGCISLEMVGFRGCQLKEINATALPIGLRALIATDNKIASISQEIGNLHNLQKLMLTGNRLTRLPKEILECSKLELLRISNNSLAELPEWIFELPELTWLADSGNSYSHATRDRPVDSIHLNELELGENLGNSANNTVQAAIYNGERLAVKLFGSPHLSTDGSPDAELNANLQVGDHKHIPGALHVVKIGETITGITMRQLPTYLKKLGNPPDFATLTRDVYPETISIDIPFIITCARGISAALAHMHSRGVAHGDIYAHNILTDEFGNAQLIDLGAASCYEKGTAEAQAKQQLDIRAFGVLIDELLARSAAGSHRFRHSLEELRDQCLQKNQKLSFRLINQFLNSMN